VFPCGGNAVRLHRGLLDICCCGDYVELMSVEDIKKGIESLGPDELGEVASFLFRVRHAGDAGYEKAIQDRLGDKDASQWLSPDEFEKRLAARV
jgi:hypothetical protein